ncbi:hypothetical protein [uncultured Erythrobacter sp.]|uniref:hypothetical protein n=1 Tax=uncultured Erythrobacter sp. TaxID=263913 RepID=UPI002630B70E|nr:hypothetical protein [uncultured Erythrobacter sp.]
MTGIALQGWLRPSENADNTARVAIIALGLVLCLQLALAFTKSINWDEFYHFSQIHAAWRGEDVGSLLQRPFVPLFSWVPSLGGSNIENIQLIRSLIIPFELLLVGAIVAAATKFTDFRTAVLCGLAYATAGYAFTQGLALRADVIAASLVMTALAVGLHRELRPATLPIMGVLTALAFVATIKVVLYLPAFLALVVLRWEDLKRWIWVAPFAGVLGLGLLALTMPDALTSLGRTLSGSFDRMFGGGVFPQHMHWVRQSAMASVFTVLLIGFAVWLFKAKSAQKTPLALLALPALWPAIYFNSYPYFFAFILPPVAVALAPVIKIAAKRYGALALTAIFTLNAVALFLMEPRSVQTNQAAVQNLVNSAFPEPVAYIDESGMIGDFPRAVPQFASGWALNNYLSRGEPIYSQAIMAQPVPLILSNSLTLRNAFSDEPIGERLLPKDAALLRDNYIQQAGIVMVAGKQLDGGSERVAELVAVPGAYRVEGGAIRIDGHVYEPGSVVALERQSYDLANTGNSIVTLRWAAAGTPQASDITFLDLYSGY